MRCVRAGLAVVVSALVLGVGGFSAPARAATLLVDFTGLEIRPLYFGLGDHVILTFDIGANAHVTGFDSDLTVTTISPGAVVGGAYVVMSNSAASEGLIFAPFYHPELPDYGVELYFSTGTATWVESVDLVALGGDFRVGADGLLRLELYGGTEYDTSPAAIFNRGSIAFTYEAAGEGVGAVPEPDAWALMIIGFGLAGACLRLQSARTDSISRIAALT